MQIKIKKEDAERDAPLIGMQHPVLSDFKLLKKNKHEATYEKIDPLTFTRTYPFGTVRSAATDSSSSL